MFVQGARRADRPGGPAGAQLYRPAPRQRDLPHRHPLEAGEDPAAFCRRAKARSAAQTRFICDGPWAPDELVYFSCLPWFPLTAVTNERDEDPADSVPRVTWGRWQEEGDRTILHLSLELNHRLLDGVHVGQFYAALNRWMEEELER